MDGGTAFDRLIRFEDEHRNIAFGNLDRNMSSDEIIGQEVLVLQGNLQEGFNRTNERRKVNKDCPIVLSVGFNYTTHVGETKSKLPLKPVCIVTPGSRISGPTDDIIVHDEAQSQLDYEGELAVIIKKDAKDVSEEEAMDYVLGYAASNDVSARSLYSMELQHNQVSQSKSFDTFGPIGPIIARHLIKDPYQLDLTTTVNGDVRQSANTRDMLWKIDQVIAWSSRNRTIRAGTVIMTGTTGGTGWGDGRFLKDGDVVKVEIGEVGTVINKIVFI